jgi:hypothetical protein
MVRRRVCITLHPFVGGGHAHWPKCAALPMTAVTRVPIQVDMDFGGVHACCALAMQPILASEPAQPPQVGLRNSYKVPSDRLQRFAGLAGT